MAKHGLKERLASGLALAYLSQAVAVLMGFFVTRIILQNIPKDLYGTWMTALQIAGFANLLDFGALTLLPRDVAVLKEKQDPDERRSALDQRVAAVTRAVLLQTAILFALAGLSMIALRFTGRNLSVELIAFALLIVAMRPARLFYAVLDGLQEFAKLGSIGIFTQILTGLATIAFVFMGWGILGVICGWFAGQAYGWVAMVRTLHKRESELVGAIRRAPFEGKWSLQVKSGWMLSLQQLTQVLLAGTDVLFITWIMGPGAVPAYACTTKAGNILANLPSTIMIMFVPTLASLRQTRSDGELKDIIRALAFLMLTIAGVVALGTYGVNREFVAVWVGSSFYLGDALTIVLGVAVFVRQAALVLITAAFAWGEEIAIAKTGILEACTFAVLALLGLRLVGIEAIPLASITAMVLVSMPGNGRAITRRVQGVFSSLLKMLSQCSLMLGVAALVLYLAKNYAIESGSLVQAAAATALSLALYGAISLWLFRREKLIRFVPEQVLSLLHRFRVAGLLGINAQGA